MVVDRTIKIRGRKDQVFFGALINVSEVPRSDNRPVSIHVGGESGVLRHSALRQFRPPYAYRSSNARCIGIVKTGFKFMFVKSIF